MEIWNAGESETIEAFLQYRNLRNGTDYKVTKKPDEHEHNTHACDGIAECSSGARPLAIEHTKVEAHHGQTKDDWIYFKLVAPLDLKMQAEPSLIGVTVEFKETCPPKGPDWAVLAEMIFKFVSEEAVKLADNKCIDISGRFPVDFSISKNLAGPVGPARTSQATRVEVEMPQLMVEAVQRKIVQLRTETAEVYDRILLLQMRDPHMYSAHEVPSVFKDKVLPSVENEVADLSEIWMMLSMPDNKDQWMTARLYPTGGDDGKAHFTDSASVRARFHC